jgi:hypothetical protein
MSVTTRATSVACLTAMAFLLASGPACAFTPEEVKCRAAVAKAGTRLARTVLKSFATCHKQRNADPELDATDCNDATTGDLQDKLPSAIERFTLAVSDACPTQSPASLLYVECPGSCAEAVPALADFGDVGDCLACVVAEQLETFSAAAFSEPDPTLEPSDAACHKSITQVGSKLVTSILKTVSRCQASAEKGGASTTTACTDTNYAELVAGAVLDATAALETRCGAVALPNTRLDACSLPDTIGELASCVVGTSGSSAQVLTSLLLALPEITTTTIATTTTTTTSTTLPPSDPECPATADVVVYSRETNQTCTTNGDCAAPRVCGDAGRCVTGTDLDMGWVGLAHDLDENSGDRIRLDLNCPGPADPGCGTCTVTGVNPQPGNCRCANDTRVACNDPLSPSSPDCAGGACNCYFGAPTPVTAQGTPTCLVRRFDTDAAGSIDVDSGATALSAQVRLSVHLGAAVTQPCPTCGGTCTDDTSRFCDRDEDCVAGTCTLDALAGDGTRGGTCTGGASAGLSCDVASTNASYPAYPSATGGSGYSLDCMPSPGTNISGAGLKIDLEQSTGTETLAFGLSCGGVAPDEDCACLVCSADPTVACEADSDCSGQQGKCTLATGSSANRCDDDSDCDAADAGVCRPTILRCSNATSFVCATNADCDTLDLGSCAASTCTSRSFGNQPLPNDCVDLACGDAGGGEGECTTGPDLRYCDGMLRAEGAGIYGCSDNVDCDVPNIGVDAGNCTLSARNECFLDPIVATGAADAEFPVLAAAYCSPPTSNAGINAVTGLPGPVRSVQQTSLTTYCGSNPAVVYTPGAGGCP